MSKKVLITGGTGLVGKRLTQMLHLAGYTVTYLSRKRQKGNKIKTYNWDIDSGNIDVESIRNADYIINLAGAGIADKNWTDARKKLIINSRTKSTSLLVDTLSKEKHSVKALISASAVGYYSNRGDELVTEDSAPANDFLGKCCVLWENEVDKAEKLNIRTVKLRIGVVLSERGGALPKMAAPVKYFVGSALGSGKQWVSWIHLDDLCNMFIWAIENEEIKGTFNAVAPNPVTNLNLTKAIGNALHRTIWAPNVPSFILKIIFGEMSAVVLGSTKASASKVLNAGFKFKYSQIQPTIIDLLANE